MMFRINVSYNFLLRRQGLLLKILRRYSIGTNIKRKVIIYLLSPNPICYRVDMTEVFHKDTSCYLAIDQRQDGGSCWLRADMQNIDLG